MKKTLLLINLLLVLCLVGNSKSIQKGPYTVTEIAKNVYHFEDGNDSNPPGLVLNDDGQMESMNNCSDMYLIVGKEKALLIDLSNNVKWDSTATESLRSLVYERVGDKKFYITITHNHGDHLGMLPAFVDDEKASFWIPKEEFNGKDIFPEGRTAYFAENASFDLGGEFVINTTEVPGHTAHSTLFFLKDKDLVFSGDAIGSGTGVWLFNEESFYTYKDAIDKLISYIENPVNHIDLEKLQIHGGHAWQSAELGKLTSQYIYDMQTLMQEMAKGNAETEEMTASFLKFLDTNFKYGTATITWNKEAADRYVDAMKK
ncbi:MBL fold metallo-hydrolase [Draconibacterium sp. IB214405]|uniref:MBL fold metallo-hydrolase n=1 Tax=Draconibacterium sp. IB214405 TaxID=3097352 RepID=UPI002A14197F|nr:MBL fold metallo-hydrolase [Draconibacterium sp. IB214405]MDX8338956.1 MBL fold metallo-hydrolase [Draconibacterium sp. IB214405]